MVNNKLICIPTSAEKVVSLPDELLFVNDATSFKLTNQVYFLLFLSLVLGLLIVVSILVFYRRRLKMLQHAHSAEPALALNEGLLTNPISDDPEVIKKAGRLQFILQLVLKNDPGFLVKFNPFDQTFAEKILSRAPKLGDKELEFCAMLRLNFETMEIASYTGWSVQAIEEKKHRIRKKLGIPSYEDLNSWIINV